MAACEVPRALAHLRGGMPAPTACGSGAWRSMLRHASTAPDRGPADLLQQLVNYEQSGVLKDAASKGTLFDLGRMHRLLAELGDPHKAWPVIHVAGSKGKGSTTTMLSSILRAAGYKVGTYTSPHMHHLGERMVVNGVPMPPVEVEHLVSRHADVIRARTAAEQGALSHFEATTALAFRHFADKKVDVAVVETGMGGILDATNVFSPANLAAAVITSLGYEHLDALGGSIESIAAAKAGIMKPTRPVVVARQVHASVNAVLKAAASAAGCELLAADELVHVSCGGYEVVNTPTLCGLREHVSLALGSNTEAATALLGASWKLGPLTTRMVGAHQHDNMAAAVAASARLRSDGWKITDEALSKGLAAAHIPGRLQVLPLPRPPDAVGSRTGAPGPQPPLVVLDGAHSPESASSLAIAVRHAFPDAPLALVVAMATDKDHAAVLAALRQLTPHAVVFTTVPIAGSYLRAAAPGTLAAQWQVAGMLAPPPAAGALRPPRCRELIQASLGAAYEKAKHELRGQAGRGVLVITGSLHAVAAAQQIEELAEVLARAVHHEQEMQG